MAIENDGIIRAGDLLRKWREHRSLSQMDLSLAAGVSARHLSFVETGRANASRKLLLRLGGVLRLDYRQQNLLLHLAGYAPAYPEPALEDPRMAPVWDAISQLLNQHEPYPAVVVRPNYDILWRNHGFQKLTTAFAGEDALDRYPNVYRLLFARDGLQPYFEDWDAVETVLLARLFQEAVSARRDDLWSLFRALGGDQTEDLIEGIDPAGQVILPFTLRKEGLRLRLFSTITAFNYPVSVTVQEMRIESVFPADAESRERYLERFDRKR